VFTLIYGALCVSRATTPQREPHLRLPLVFQAFLIAFTSEFIPRLLYRYVEGDGTLAGYVNFTLAHAPPNAGDLSDLLGQWRKRPAKPRCPELRTSFWLLG